MGVIEPGRWPGGKQGEGRMEMAEGVTAVVVLMSGSVAG